MTLVRLHPGERQLVGFRYRCGEPNRGFAIAGATSMLSDVDIDKDGERDCGPRGRLSEHANAILAPRNHRDASETRRLRARSQQRPARARR